MNFEAYYEEVCAALKKRGFSDKPNRSATQMDFLGGKSVEQSVAAWANEWAD